MADLQLISVRVNDYDPKSQHVEITVQSNAYVAEGSCPDDARDLEEMWHDRYHAAGVLAHLGMAANSWIAATQRDGHHCRNIIDPD